MRLVSALLFVALTGAGALADDATPADPQPDVMRQRLPFRVVKLLPETRQVLLFDRDRGNHVVAEVGQSLEGYLVDDIEADAVTFVAGNGTQIILTAPPPRHERRSGAKARPADPSAEPTAGATASASDAPRAPTSAPAMPVDPYAEPAPPATPGEGGVRVASAAGDDTEPFDAGAPDADPGITAFADAVGATPVPVRSAPPATSTSTLTAPPATSTSTAAAPPATSTSTPTAPPATSTSTPPAPPAPPAPADDTGSALAAALTGAPPPSTASSSTTTGTPAAAPASASTSAAGATTLTRAELDGALADFPRLAASFRATFTPDGLRFDALGEGTLLTRIGLRKGDVITSIDGQPLRSLDDAANLYARASSLQAATIQVTRAGTPVTLRVAIR